MGFLLNLPFSLNTDSRPASHSEDSYDTLLTQTVIGLKQKQISPPGPKLKKTKTKKKKAVVIQCLTDILVYSYYIIIIYITERLLQLSNLNSLIKWMVCSCTFFHCTVQLRYYCLIDITNLKHLSLKLAYYLIKRTINSQ